MELKRFSEDDSSGNPPSLRVQVVLFENDILELTRALHSVANALQHATPAIGSWTVAFGDSSPSPVLDQATVRTFEQRCADAGGSFESVYFDANLGHGGGHNRLHANATEDLLLILNPDGILAPDAVARLVAALSPGVGVVDARQLPMEHPKEYDVQTGNASWSSLACALTPSEVFRSVGGIDHETFFMYCDDVDYSWRVRLAGLTAKYCPQARMFHDKRIDAMGRFVAGDTERYYSAEAALLLAYKYSRDDIVQNLEKAMGASQDVHVGRAVMKFRELRDGGQLPTRIDPSNVVAEFTEGAYGGHRF